MTKECTLNELDDVLQEVYESGEYDGYEVEAEDMDDSIISIEGIRIVIPELNASVRQGDVCVYDEDEEYYCPDFSVTLIYEKDETDPQKYLYWESDGIMVSLYNYFYGKNYTMDDFGNMNCIVEIEEM